MPSLKSFLQGPPPAFTAPLHFSSPLTHTTLPGALSPRQSLTRVSPRRLLRAAMSAGPTPPAHAAERASALSVPSVAARDELPSTRATLLVSCPDQKGIVAVVSQLLSGYGCNIVSSDQFTDTVAAPPLYFQRVEFDYSALSVAPANIAVLERSIGELAARYEMKTRLTLHRERRKVAVLVSRADHCLYDLLLRFRSGELPRAEVVVVISNHPELKHVAEHFGVPYEYVPIEKEKGKEMQEARIEEVLAEHDVGCIVLARYMQIMSAAFCERHGEHMINIHHSFLPSFVGSKPYHQAHKHGVKLIGATAHFVSAVLDAGPIIHQSVTNVSHRDTPKDMVRKGRDLERITLALALRWFLLDRILISGGRTVVFEE